LTTPETYSVDKLTAQARRLAAEYRRATGKTLPLSGEIAVNDAVRILGLEPVESASAGCDAVRKSDNEVQRLQIKGRVVFDEAKSGQRLGQLKLDQAWDELILVLMNEEYEPTEIYAANRAVIESVLEKKASNKRGAMTVAQFKIISRCLWTAASGFDLEAG
jgi:hypothetical protein